MLKGIIVFDFDGTLTCQKNSMTMWNLLWAGIGKSQKGALLYSMFHRGIISREAWFQETEQEFYGTVNRVLVSSVANSIKLKDNAVELFRKLTGAGYELYILSGGIGVIIDEVLASSRLYFTDISANDIVFNEKGELVQLKMTPYDYDGKVDYIESLIRRIGVHYDCVYFVGNSVNDLSVLSLPIKTICISPFGLTQGHISRWDYICTDLKTVEYYILR